MRNTAKMTEQIPNYDVIPDRLVQAWLSFQCQMIPHVHRAVVVARGLSNNTFTTTACWPDLEAATYEMVSSAQHAITRNSPEIKDYHNNCGDRNAASLLITCPLGRNGQTFAGIAVQLQAIPKHQRDSIVQLLMWGSSWLKFICRQESLRSDSQDAGVLIDTMASLTKYQTFREASLATVKLLAVRWKCKRVSLGWRHGNTTHIEAISSSEGFDSRSNFVRNITAVMDEVQDTTINYPLSSTDSSIVVNAHERLSRQEQNEAVLTVPIISHEQVIGVITLERDAERPFDMEVSQICQRIANFAGPVLDLMYRRDRSAAAKIYDYFIALAERFMSTNESRFRIGLVASISIAIFLLFASGEYRISAPATIEGSVQRAVIAPYDSYIAATHARAGETVMVGDVIAELDDKDLKIEQRKWQSHKEEYNKQYRKALAGLDHSQVRILSAQIDQAEAQLELLNEQLARTQLVAPISGIVISGDLSRSLDTPVERGQILFEVAPLDNYRVVMEVSDTDIADVQKGQTGYLKLSSMPSERFSMIVESISIVSPAEEGKATFRVEAKIESVSKSLRPGMQGIGKIVAGERKLVWIWTRELVAWVRLKLWAWLS